MNEALLLLLFLLKISFSQLFVIEMNNLIILNNNSLICHIVLKQQEAQQAVFSKESFALNH